MSSFVSELQRRNVFQVSAAYAVAGWLLMQLAVVLESTLHLPSWFDTLTTVLVVIGFPIAALLAWIFQFSSNGLVRTQRNPDLDDKTHAKNTVTIFSLTALLTLSLILILWLHLSDSAVVTQDAERLDDANQTLVQAGSVKDISYSRGLFQAGTQSIAVLPFDDFSAEKDQSYFGRGISEELLNVLSRVKGLRVVSRTSSFAFANSDSTVTEIAQALEVSHVLEGSIRKSGDTIRITAQLINALSDEHLWSQTFDRTLSAENLFAVQDEITSAIVSQLKGTLRVVPIADFDKTLSLRAYELYLEARENKKQRTPDTLLRAEAGFLEVIDLDPKFAPAYSGLAETYLLMNAYAGMDKKLSLEKAQPLINRALDLAPQSAEVLVAAADFASEMGGLDAIQEAEGYARQAININENYADAYFLLGGILWDQSQLSEAIENYKQARILDPLSATVLTNLARAYLFTNELASAKQIAQELTRFHPNLPFGYSVLADIALREGSYEQAHTQLQNAFALNQQDTSVKRKLRRLYRLVGLYDTALWYQNDPSGRAWHAIYTNDLGAVSKDLALVSDLSDMAWLLYYLRNYEKTNQLVSGYVKAYQLLERPISDSGSASYIIALAHIQKALGQDNQDAIKVLDAYFEPIAEQDQINSNELSQLLLYASVKGEYKQSYRWLDAMLDREYLTDFLDPIFDDIKQEQAFLRRQSAMETLRARERSLLESQLAAPQSSWIVPLPNEVTQ